MRKPSEMFRQLIEPAYDDYLKDPLSERLANILAAALDHQVDWTFSYYKAVDPSRLDGAPEVKSFRRKLLVLCRPLQIMNDLADAAHHRFLTRKNDPPRVVKASTKALFRADRGLHVTGYNTPFLKAATDVVEFWRKWKD